MKGEIATLPAVARNDDGRAMVRGQSKPCPDDMVIVGLACPAWRVATAAYTGERQRRVLMLFGGQSSGLPALQCGILQAPRRREVRYG